MNDVQTNLRRHASAIEAVNIQQERLTAATEHVNRMKNTYLDHVVHTAVLKEKARRKADSLTGIVSFACVFIIGIIGYMINSFIGLGLFTLGFCIVAASRQKSAIADAENYKKRKAFFAKYDYAIPEDENLEWK